MTLFEIYDSLNAKYESDIVIIQGSSSTYYCYGKKVGNLVRELNLLQPVEENQSIKLSKDSIIQIEGHLIERNYRYIVLDLTIDLSDKEYRKHKWGVTKSNIFDAIGEHFDNRNKAGNYPKKIKKAVEIAEYSDLTDNNNENNLSNKIELNPEQKKTLRNIDEWISSSNSIAILSGRAGSGKTTLLKSVVTLLEIRKKTYVLLAPTGRASRVLSKKTNREARTIHKEIYEFDIDKMKINEDDDKQQLAFEESDFSLDFKIKAQENIAQIYIIDEASMIGDNRQAKGELNFGSGKILDDLLLQIGVIHRKNVNTKILFVGDKMQLPPIREINSVALEPDYLLRKFKLPELPQYFELTTVMRQAKNSLVLSNAENLRKKILDNNFSSLKIIIDNKSVFRTTVQDSQYDGISANDFSRRIMVTRSNATAYGYNKSIRASRFGVKDIDALMIGDQIIVTTNSPLYDCFNGDILTVIKIIESDVRTVELNKSGQYKNKPKKINLFFKKLIVRPIEYSDDKYNKSIVIIENLLNKPEIFLDTEETIASRVDWNNRIRDLDLSSDEKKKNFFDDKYINAVRIKYAYAITCHKAQGGEWDDVTIFLQGLSHTSEYYRWLYTAMTRSSNKLSFINLQEDYVE